MVDQKGNQEAEKREEVTEQKCLVEMFFAQPCGRQVHPAPGVDNEPVCLMHSKDPDKSIAAFQGEFERILSDAGEGDADFTSFVFPNADYHSREFRAVCRFSAATFTQDADFSGATFTQDAYFGGAPLTHDAFFGFPPFTLDAHFRGAKFTQDANFNFATFTQDAYFEEVSFTRYAHFDRAKFMQDAHFNGATFTQDAYFNGAKFTQDAYFRVTTFTQDAYFYSATFTQDAYFNRATFTQVAQFDGAKFTQDAHFEEARFAGEADFTVTKFTNNTFFLKAIFERRVTFYRTEFPKEDKLQFYASFSLARFEKPEDVLFFGKYLGRVFFLNCDVSRFQLSSVQWRQRRGNKKRMVFEEFIDTNEKDTLPMRLNGDNPDERNYDLIAELYQQLKKNYDNKGDYWTAGDFHYGEMEMKRKSSSRHNSVLRWLHRNLGLVAWYKYASDYGESYVKPFLSLLFVLGVFTFIYPAFSLHRVSSEKGSPSRPVGQTRSLTPDMDKVSYANLFQFLTSYQNRRLRGTGEFFAQSAMTTVSVASLGRVSADYEPQSLSGRFAALIELLLTSTLIALFLLAVQRQVRR